MSSPIRTVTARERRQDLILGGVMFVGGMISTALCTIAELYGDTQAPPWMAVAYVAFFSAAVTMRRVWPAPIAVAVALSTFLAASLQIPELYAGTIAMFITLYTVGAWMNNRRAAALVRIGIIVGMLIWSLIWMYTSATDAANEADIAAGFMSPLVAFLMLQAIINLLSYLAGYYFGEHAWAQALQRQALEKRTADLEEERERTAAQAVALERVRIARELHDVVAHHVSVMGVQAGAARMVLHQDGEKAEHMLENVEGSAREAITELRNLLETLRAPGGEEDSASTLGIDDIPALVDAANTAGLPTHFTVIGDPVAVPSVVEVNLYRIAQESLTNARRHAGQGATADVRLRYERDDIELEIVNTGRVALGARPGLGQLGMRERALASGGSIESGPRDRGGWRVRTRIPVHQGAELLEVA